jgi:hypothetical protein
VYLFIGCLGALHGELLNGHDLGSRPRYGLLETRRVFGRGQRDNISPHIMLFGASSSSFSFSYLGSIYISHLNTKPTPNSPGSHRS